MSQSLESDEEFMDRHALLCERFSLDLDRIDDNGSVLGLDTHGVVARDLELLGPRLTTVGVGLKNAGPVYAHSRGELALDHASRQRGAVLLAVSSLLTEVYEDDGLVARTILKGSGIPVEGKENTAPILVISDSPDGRHPALYRMMSELLPRIYYL